MLDRFIKFGQTPPHEIRPQFRQHPRTGKKFRTASKLGRPALILGVPDVIEGSYVRSWVYKDDYIRDLSRRTA